MTQIWLCSHFGSRHLLMCFLQNEEEVLLLGRMHESS